LSLVVGGTASSGRSLTSSELVQPESGFMKWNTLRHLAFV
jgi:hypothetical protein